MTRPDDIPEWAWEKANEALMEGPLFHISIVDWDAQQAVFAKAILAAVEEEREACAQTVERDGPQRYYNMHGQPRGLSELEAHLASAIRNRS